MSMLDIFKRKNFSTSADEQPDRRQAERTSVLEAKMHQGYEPDASFRDRGNLYSNVTFNKYSDDYTDDSLDVEKRGGITPSKNLSAPSDGMGTDTASQPFMSQSESSLQQGEMGAYGASGLRGSELQSGGQSNGIDSVRLDSGAASDADPSNNSARFGRNSASTVTTGGNPEGEPPVDDPEDDDDGGSNGLDVQSTPANGQEGTAIPLNIVTNYDGDASDLQYSISGVMTGAILSAGQNMGGGLWRLTASEITNLFLIPPAYFSGNMNLTITATADDGSVILTDNASLAVSISGVASAPVLIVQNVTGNEDSAVPLLITAATSDPDGETLSIVIGNVPAGVSLSAGINNGNGTWTLLPSELNLLTLTPPANFSGSINLTVTAISSENGTTSQVISNMNVGIQGVADAPNVAASAVTTTEDTPAALNITASLNDMDGSEILSITIGGVPVGAILSAGTNNGGGTWTLTPAQLIGLMITPAPDFSGNFNLSISATSSENGTTATTNLPPLAVTVAGVADTPNLSLANVSGIEDTAIALGIISSLNGGAATEVLSIVISNVPTGAVLSAGTNNGGGIWTVTPAQLTGLTLTPPLNFSGQIDVVVTAIVSEGGTTAETDLPISIMVSGVADTPSLTAQAVNGNEGSAIALNIAASLNDTDGSEILSIIIDDVPTGVTLSAGIDNGDGSWTLTPTELTGLMLYPLPLQSGEIILSVKAIASENGTTAETFPVSMSVMVDGVANVPNLAVQPASGDEDTAIPLDIAASLNDTDGSESLFIVVGNMPAGSMLSAGINNGNGTWTLIPAQLSGLTITPPSNFSGSIHLAVSAVSSEDGTTAFANATLSVSVAGVADIPNVTVQPSAGPAGTALPLDIAASLSDTDGSEILSVIIGNVPAGSVLSAGIDNGDGTWTLTVAELTVLTITPPAFYSGTLNLSVIAVASENATTAETTPVTLPVYVGGTADTPTLSVLDASGTEDTAIPLIISAALTDLDGSETLSILIANMPAGATLSAGINNGNGSWTLTPAQIAGLTILPPANFSGHFDLTVSAISHEGPLTNQIDDILGVDVAGVADAPIVTAPPVSGDEDTAIVLNMTAALADTDGSEILSVIIGNVPAGGILSAGVDNGDGTWTLTAADISGLTYTPPLNGSGLVTFSITATASENATTATTISSLAITVEGVADAPNVSVSPASGDENTAIALNITASLNDTDGSEILSIIVGNMPTGAVLSAGINNGDGTWTLTPVQLAGLTYTPPTNASGIVNLSVSAIASENGTTATLSSNLAINVAGVATAPILSALPASGDEDTAIALNITAALSDTDGSEILSIVIGNVPTGAVLSSGVDNGDGTWTLTSAQLAGLTYTPPEHASGIVNLSITATSSENATTSTLSTNLPVTVAGVADQPSLVVVDATGAENSAVSLDITALLVDTDGSEVLSITISGVPSGAVLSAGLNAGGGVWVLTPAQLTGLTLTPATNYNGVFALSIVALSSENGTTASVSASLPVTIVGVASTPLLVVSAATGLEDNAIPLTITAGLTDASEILSIVIGNVPAGATLSHGLYAGGGNWSLSPSDLAGLTITPPQHYSGPIALTVTAVSTEENGADTTLTAALNVTVTPVADAPSVSTAPVTGSEDTAISLNIAASLTDTSEVLSVTISGVPTGAVLSAGTNLGAGVWSLTAAQLTNLRVTPPTNSDSDFTLNIAVRSTESNGAIATVNTSLAVSVNGVADIPTVSASNTASLGNQVNLTISGALTDTDGSETLTYVVHGVPDGFALSAGINNGDNTWTLRPSDLSGLKMTAPEQFNGQLNLNVTAVSHDSNNSVAVSAPTPFYARFANYASGYLVELGIGVNIGGIGVGVHVGVLPDIDLLPASGGLLGTNGIYTKEDTSFLIADAPNLLAIPVVSAVLALLSRVQFSGIPAGVTFSNGTNMGGGVWQFTQAQLNNLYLNPLPNSDVDFTIVMSLKLILGVDVALFSVPVHMMGVADMPTLTVTAGTGAEDTAIALNITGALTDNDGSESFSFLVSGMPAGFILNHGINNANGTWSLTAADLTGLTVMPAANYSGTANITVSAISTEREGDQTVRQQSVSMVVTAAVDAAIVSPVAIDANEGQAVLLDLGISLRDTDGSETISAVLISGLPAGASLLGATDNNNGTWSADIAHLNQVQFVSPTDYSGNVTLNIGVTTRESSTGATTTTSSNLSVHVLGIADTPMASASDSTGDSGTAIALNLGAALTDTDGSESLSVVISGVPDYAMLSAGLNNGDGTWTLSNTELSGLSITPPDGFTGDINLTMTAYSRDGQSSVASAQEIFSVHVMPAPAAMMAFSMMDNDSLLSGGWVDMDGQSFNASFQGTDFFSDSSAVSLPDNSHDQAFQNHQAG